jgi:hypothetical protein
MGVSPKPLGAVVGYKDEILVIALKLSECSIDYDLIALERNRDGQTYASLAVHRYRALRIGHACH